jgi:hypothetical protein
VFFSHSHDDLNVPSFISLYNISDSQGPNCGHFDFRGVTHRPITYPGDHTVVPDAKYLTTKYCSH